VVHIADGSLAAILGGISIDEEYKPQEIRIAPAALLQVAGALTVTVGYVVNPADIVIHADVIKVGGNLALTLGNQDDGTVLPNIDATASLSVKGDLTISSGAKTWAPRSSRAARSASAASSQSPRPM